MTRPVRSAIGLNQVRAAARTLIALVLLVLATLPGAGPAAAHAGLTSASPGPDSRVKGAPHQVQLIFGWPPVTDELTTVSVLTPSGRDLAAGSAVTAGLAVGQSVSGSTETGWYTVRFAVVFFDGHLTRGEYRFHVTTPNSGSDPTRWLWILVGLATIVVLYVLALVRLLKSHDLRPTNPEQAP